MVAIPRSARVIALMTLTALSLASCASQGRPGAAASAASPQPSSSPQVNVVLANKQLDVPDHISAGPITFNFSTTDAKGHTVLLVRLSDGVTAQGYLAQLASIATDPAHAGEAASKAASQGENLGGAVLTKAAPVSFTTVLPAGTYNLLDFNSAGVSDPNPVVRSFQVAGDAAHAVVPASDTVIVQADVDGKARYVAPEQLPTEGTMLVANQSSGGEEATLIPVKPGTTDADLAAYFAAFVPGAAQTDSPFVGGPIGMPVMSPGHQGLVHYTAPAGTYALVSFAVDPQTGHRRAAEGVAKIVTVR